MVKIYEDIQYNANLKVNREYYQTKLGKKLQSVQWKHLEALIKEFGYMGEDGLIKQDILDKVVKIKKLTGSKYVPNKKLFDTFITWWKMTEQELQKNKGGIYCSEVWNRAVDICKRFALYEPGNSTVYGWFRKADIKFDKYAKITVTQAQDVYALAYFSNIKYSRKSDFEDPKAEVTETAITITDQDFIDVAC